MRLDREERFAALFRRHHMRVRRYVTRRAWPDAVDDVVAETFLTAWRRFDQVPADELPWLLTTARNCLANHRRGALRGAALLERLRAQPVVRAVDDTAHGAQRDSVLRALAALDEPDRELLLMVGWDGLSPGEAASALGFSAPVARARLYRARRKFRSALDAEGRASDSTIRGNVHEVA